MPLPKNSQLTPLSRTLRKQMTKQEKRLWYDFLRKYIVQFNRQKVIGKYIVDFYCHAARLVVEVDGGQHYEEINLQKDIERTKVLNSIGLEILRFTNYEIDNHFPEVCMRINAKVEKSLLPGLEQQRDE
jgi:very-short-patch-repair endonuclease